MLAKKPEAVHASNFRPVAMVHLFCKTFAYMVLGFRLGWSIRSWLALKVSWTNARQRNNPKTYRIEKHLLTANLFVDHKKIGTTCRHGLPLGVSKASDRACWPSPCHALSSHVVLEYLIWILFSVDVDQLAEIMGDWNQSHVFNKSVSVTQGCVESKVFALQWAMATWKMQNKDFGFDGHRPKRLLDLRLFC